MRSCAAARIVVTRIRRASHRAHRLNGAGIGLGLGVTISLWPSKSSANAARAPLFSVPAIGCAGTNARTPHRDICAHARSRHAWCCGVGHDRLPARCGAIWASTARSGQHATARVASCTASAGSVAISSMCPAPRASRLARLRPTPTTRATDLRFFSARQASRQSGRRRKQRACPPVGSATCATVFFRARAFMRRGIAAALRESARFPLRGRC